MNTFIFSEVTIDGKMTVARGKSSKEFYKIFDEEDFRFIHSFRNKVDGIMVGKSTIIIDNPSLTNRYYNDKKPIRIIPSLTLDFKEDSTILTDNNETIIVTTLNNINNEKVEKIKRHKKECVFFGQDEVDFVAFFNYLEKERNFKNIMIEGGGKLNYNLIKNNLIDEIILLQLPIIVGGENNVTLVDGEGFNGMKFNFILKEVKNMNKYIYIRYQNINC